MILRDLFHRKTTPKGRYPLFLIEIQPYFQSQKNTTENTIEFQLYFAHFSIVFNRKFNRKFLQPNLHNLIDRI